MRLRGWFPWAARVQIASDRTRAQMASDHWRREWFCHVVLCTTDGAFLSWGGGWVGERDDDLLIPPPTCPSATGPMLSVNQGWMKTLSL